MMKNFYLERVEEKHFYMRDGRILFEGTPDNVRHYSKRGLTIVLDYKFGRGEVPEADVNMQLRAYLVMVPGEDVPESMRNQGYSGEFRPSALLRFKLCPGSLALERKMRADGLTMAETDDAAEGRLMHAAAANPKAPRDHLTPEQLETVERSETMAEEFVKMVLAGDGAWPYYGAIIQPRTREKADTVFYTKPDILKAKTEIDEIFDKAQEPDAKRNASADACKFCLCKTNCPEYDGWLMEVEKIRHLPSAKWTGEMWDVFLTRRLEFSKFLEQRYEEAKKILGAIPEAIPGWTLKDGNKVRRVTDLPAAWVALQGMITAKEFSDACTVALGTLEEAYWRKKQASGNAITQKEATAAINVALHGIIELKQNAPSVTKAKEEK
jgi:Protein of unknown function (DUF2800)